MAVQLVREWTAIQQFPAATQEKLVDLLSKLKNQDVNTLTILVMGKGGVGKSSTVNSIIGERVVTVSAFQSETPRPVIVSRSRSGFTLNIIDTPGLVEGGYVSDQVLDTIKSFLGRFLLNKTIDVLLYVDRLDAYRVDNLDKQIVKAITDSFGKDIWQKSMVVLTHAQLSPPDLLSYEEFFSRRSESLLKCIRQGGRISKADAQNYAIPVSLVENSGRCNKNEFDEKILPTGTPWIPNLVRTITEITLNGKKGIVVDKKLIEGPNANDRGKRFIPLILAFEEIFMNWSRSKRKKGKSNPGASKKQKISSASERAKPEKGGGIKSGEVSVPIVGVKDEPDAEMTEMNSPNKNDEKTNSCNRNTTY